MKFIFDQWRTGNVVPALFLDVKRAFPSVEIQKLIHNMQMKGVPQEYTNWDPQQITRMKNENPIQ